jgi:GDPmannose 4,6-dehydratase
MSLGCLDLEVEMGHAKEYMETAWKIMQLEKADDFVISTGETHTIREYVEEAFSQVNIEIKWEGEGLDEKGFNKITNEEIITINPKFARPGKIRALVGDITKAKETFGFEPKIKFKELIRKLIEDYKIKLKTK